MTNPCPLCGSASAPKFDPKSDWCQHCAGDVLAEQDELRHEVQRPEVIGE